MFQRHQRVESLIKEELSKLVIKELEFPGALVTITNVDVQKDLDYANVKASVIPKEKDAAVLKILQKSQKYLTHLMIKKLNIKPMPEIRFEIDYGMEKAAELEKVFLDLSGK